MVRSTVLFLIIASMAVFFGFCIIPADVEYFGRLLFFVSVVLASVSYVIETQKTILKTIIEAYEGFEAKAQQTVSMIISRYIDTVKK